MATAAPRMMQGRIRIVHAGTRRIMLNHNGTPVDGGGHASWMKARWQAQAINAGIRRQHQQQKQETAQ